MASQLTKRGYKYRVLPTNDSDIFNDFLNDDSEFNIKKLDTDLEKLDDKVLLEGKRQQKFDFIENKVVQDGLQFTEVNYPLNTTIVTKNINVTDTLVFEMDLTINALESGGGWICTLNKKDGSYAGEIAISSSKLYMYLNGAYYSSNAVNFGENNIVIEITNSKVKMILNGISVISTGNFEFNFGSIALGKKVGRATLNGEVSILAYNRILAPKEIQHNLSVLNNSPSIKELHTTDSAGKTSISCFGSDENHVEMSTGRTLRDEYMGVLKTMGKEFVSSDGSPVEVNNGIEARVINAEINGRTVKNYIQTNKHTVTTNETLKAYTLPVEVGKQYTAFVKISKFELTGDRATAKMRVHTSNTTSTFKDVLITGEGIFKVTTTMSVANPIPVYPLFVANSETCNIVIDGYCLIEGDGSNFAESMIDMNIGINSTKTIISNNGESYHIYVSEEDKAGKKVASLGVVDGSYDTLEIKEDGSGVYTQNTYEIKLCGTENWENIQLDTLVNTMLFSNVLSNNLSINGKPILSSHFKWEHSLNDNEHAYTMGTNIRIIINKSRLATQDLVGFKAWLQANPVTVRYQLATPIVTHIPKELVPSILTH